MAAGRVETLVILGGNPAYDAPADLEFAAAIGRSRRPSTWAWSGTRPRVLAQWHLPEAHYLESWGDARALDGTASIQQPLIQPLYGGRTAAEVLALISGYKDRRGLRHRSQLASQVAAATPKSPGASACTMASSPERHRELWSRRPTRSASPRPSRLQRPAAGIEVNFYPSSSTWDGRFANNGWLQEAPDPMTKLTWDNAALLQPGDRPPARRRKRRRDRDRRRGPGNRDAGVDPARPRRPVHLARARLRPHRVRARRSRRGARRLPAPHQRRLRYDRRRDE